MKNNICISYQYKKNVFGDQLILTEFPENLHEIGYTFINKQNNPFLKYNPYVVENGDDIIELNFNTVDQKFICNPYNINSRSQLLFDYLGISNKPKLITPRLYIHEDNQKENIILLYLQGKEILPDNVIDHILAKYSKHYKIIQICIPLDIPVKEIGVENIHFDFYKNKWEDIAEIASKSIMFIGVAGWFSHLAQAYMPNVNLFIPSGFINYFGNKSQPFGQGTIGNQWLHPNNYYFNETERSYGFTNSYLTL